MPEVTCSCGARFEASASGGPCPKCGAVRAGGEGLIFASCECGAKFPVPSRLAGKHAKCPKCARHVDVPFAAPPLHEAPPPPKATERRPAPPSRAPAREEWRSHGRWALPLALLPFLLLASSGPENPKERLDRALVDHPEIALKLQKMAEQKGELSRKDLISALPESRLEGAFLPVDTWNHWLYGLLSLAGFWGFVLLVFPRGNASWKQFFASGLLTGAVGFLLLLVIQYVALLSQGRGMEGGVLGVLFYLVKFVGFSYGTAASDAGFGLRLVGFLFGVGLVEELCKVFPLVEYSRRRGALDLRGAIVLGLASGIGFGVGEGMAASIDLYNGIAGSRLYAARFVSCVALHAVWSAASAILLWRHQDEVRAIGRWYGWFLPIVKVLGLSTALHALYETALKQDAEAGLWVSAAASFAAFFALYEWARRREPALVAGATA